VDAEIAVKAEIAKLMDLFGERDPLFSKLEALGSTKPASYWLINPQD
jgi:hypothetical protein